MSILYDCFSISRRYATRMPILILMTFFISKAEIILTFEPLLNILEANTKLWNNKSTLFSSEIYI